MRQLKLAALVTILFVFASSAAYADKDENALRKFGLGVSLSNPTTWEVPITISPKFRLAPMISLDMSSRSVTPDGGKAVETSTSSMGFGFGAFYTKYKKKSSFLYYTGLRFMTIMNSSSTPGIDPMTMMPGGDPVDVSSMDIMFAPTVGGEYFFTSRFSLGVEFAINIMMKGDEETSKDDDKADDTSMAVNTSGSLFARIYF